jgi:7,8-dihydro-6-hydroxymethylpterin dimethyltransferase
MLDPMLALANRGAEQVRASLGFDNLRFVKGYLEEMPLETDSVDVLVSNCVLNLSPDKRRTFAEICRCWRRAAGWLLRMWSVKINRRQPSE